jgi:hypothetical protein
MTLRRTPFKRRGTGLKQVSTKRTAARDEYEAAKEQVWRRDRGTCQAGPDRDRHAHPEGWPEVECGGRLDPHHVWPTGLYPERREDPDAMIVLCRAHHVQGVHEHPIRARQLGLLV